MWEFEGLGTRISQTAGVSPRRDSTVFIINHPSSPVNFLNLKFLNFRGVRNGRKFTSHRPSESALNWAFCCRG